MIDSVMQEKYEPHYNEPCLCGVGRAFLECCRPYLTMEIPAPTAETLMRSRYSAYVLGDESYLLCTWHETSRPVQLNLNADGGLNWLGLNILACEKGGSGDTEGSVEFVAKYQLGNEAQQLNEISRFVKEDGQWFYLNGEIKS